MSGRPKISLEGRFFEKVNKTSTCWLWTGCINNKGYGRIGMLILGKWVSLFAHRVSWFLHKKEWPPDKVLHKCDTPACVNPNHLFSGSQKDNMEDCATKGRMRNGRDSMTECKRGHTLSGSNLYLKDGRRHCKECRRQWKRDKRNAAK